VTAERPVTIKIGGVAGQHADGLAVVARDAPPDTVVVHGGGNEVAEWSRRLGLEPRTHEGLRITDPETLDVVVAILGGLVNTRLVAAFQAAGRPAIGLTGADGGLLRLVRRQPELGEVGEAVDANGALLQSLVAAGLLPVIASIGLHEGALLNVNADEAAGAIAATRGGLLLLCTDVPGVQLEGRVLDRLDAATAERMLADGSASAGMRPKLRAALVAARAGCEVRIVDGRNASDLERALAGTGAGTEVTAA
jgi:acetylglutamate kinase